MNQAVYERFELNLRKNLFMFVYFENKPSSTLSLDSIIKRAKLKQNNVFVNKLMNMMARFYSI